MHPLLYYVRRRDGVCLRRHNAVRGVCLRAARRGIDDAAACSSWADTHVESRKIAAPRTRETTSSHRALAMVLGHIDCHQPHDRESPVSQRPARVMPEPATAADRWALLVLELAGSSSDPKTLAKWADAANCGYGTLRMHCYTAGVPPRRSLVFARLLRLVTISQLKQLEPERWLDVADIRTLRSLLRRGGLPRSGSRCPTIEEYIVLQRLVPVDCAALRALRQRLRLAR